MTFIILFEDNPDAAPDIRTAHMPAHLAFLKRRAATIQAAGPLFDGGGASAGGLWLVDAATEADAEALVREDPFWPTGLRKSFTALRWKQVFADGKALI
ncbi:MAG: YciI family protein [Pseudomonadota bacterium]